MFFYTISLKKGSIKTVKGKQYFCKYIQFDTQELK